MLPARLLSASACLLALSSVLAAQITTRVSVRSDGVQAAGSSITASLSGDGRFVAFASASSELVGADTHGGADTNGVIDVFVHDRWTGAVERVSVSTAGAEADADCLGPFLSADGAVVTFRSEATTLVAGDANGVSDIFVHDRRSKTTLRASIDAAGGDPDAWSYYSALSEDGRYVVFQSEASDLVANDANGTFDVFVRDLASGTTELASLGSSDEQSGFFEFSLEPAISGDGRRVAFSSLASGFVPGDQNGALDVFVRDRATGTTMLASVALGGGTANGASSLPSISADGRFVAFVSSATDLVAGDANGVADVFVHDLELGTTERVSVSSAGEEANADSYLFYSHTTISGDGSRIAFESYASNLVPGDGNGWGDVFVRDRVEGWTRIASTRPNGGGIHLGATRGTISSDGRFVGFESGDGALVAGDTNAAADVFAHALRSPCAPIESYCSAEASSNGCTSAIASAGLPRAQGPESFFVSASGARSHQLGLLVWGGAEAALPFGDGTLCVAAPLERTPAQSSEGGAGADDCSGSYSFRFDAAFWSEHALGAGSSVYAQWIGRDPGAADGWALSDAIRFALCP